jgi:hypothetical protein
MTNSTWALPPSVLSPSNNNPVRIIWDPNLRDGHCPAIGAADIRRRQIHLHPDLQAEPAEYARILTHELFHFAWVRLGNPRRDSWKRLLHSELQAHARGELGHSSLWRKAELPRHFPLYACEAFCDTAAALFAGLQFHPEFTLARRWRSRRFAWFHANTPMRF